MRLGHVLQCRRRRLDEDRVEADAVWMGLKLKCLLLLYLSLALVSACQRAQPPQPSAPGQGASGIAWFDGDVPAAFALAKREGRPVLLFWGAQWCPFCHTLKSTVFIRPDFIAKTRLFVPVYLDGDSPGAQSWGEQFDVLGYPTLVVLDSGSARDPSVSAPVVTWPNTPRCWMWRWRICNRSTQCCHSHTWAKR